MLSITTFTLSMCGTFLVRSGLLNSVHTFANDPARGIFILIFLFVLIILSLGVFFIFHKDNNGNQNNFFWLSRETSILINNWFMMYFLSVVLIGTVYPIFLDVISSEKISVGPPFYHKLIAPFLIPFLLVMAMGPRLKWIRSKIEKKYSKSNLFSQLFLADGTCKYLILVDLTRSDFALLLTNAMAKNLLSIESALRTLSRTSRPPPSVKLTALITIFFFKRPCI